MRARKKIVSGIIFFILIITIPFYTISSAEANTLLASCEIGSSASGCAAYSPQEIYNLYGTTDDGTKYVSVNGTSTQVYAMLNRTNSDNGGWILLMKAGKTSTNFGYTSNYFSSNSSTLNPSSLSNDVSTDAKFSVYNNLSVKKLLAVFKDPTAGTIDGAGVGDLSPNAFGGLVWTETLANTATAYSTLNTASTLISGTYTNVRYSLYRSSNVSSASQIFSYQAGVGTYGFALGPCSSGVLFRWGISWNNENNYTSCDAHVGIGLSSTVNAGVSVSGAGDFVPWNQMPTGSQGTGAGKGKTGFQIWGKLNDPSLGAPLSFTISQLAGNSVTASWLPPTATTPTEYILQYKLTSDSWSSSTTRRVTSPTSTPSVSISGLGAGPYDFRVWARNSNNSQSSLTPALVIAQNLDSTAPTFPSADTFNIAENTTSVGTITTSESATITIFGGEDQAKFSIARLTDSSTALSFISAPNFEAPMDVGANNSYAVVFRAVDSAANAGYETVTVTVTDVNEPPVISISGSAATHSITQAENISSVITYTGSDVDAGTTLTWSLSGTDAADLTIGSASGVLAFASNPDFEGPTDSDTNNIYIFVVTLSDGELSDTQTVTLTITNANESASVSAPSLSATPFKGVLLTITVTSSVAGKVRFFINGKRIGGCLARSTTGTYPNFSATCSWKPTVMNRQSLTARIIPTDTTFSTTTSAWLSILVGRRTGTR